MILEDLFSRWNCQRIAGTELFETDFLKNHDWKILVKFILMGKAKDLNEYINGQDIQSFSDYSSDEDAHWRVAYFFVGKHSAYIITVFKFNVPGKVKKCTIVKYDFSKKTSYVEPDDFFDKSFVEQCEVIIPESSEDTYATL